MDKLAPILKEIFDKLLLLLALKVAKDTGKKEAHSDSVEEVLEDVVKAEKQKSNQELRDIIADKYNRD